jgi:arylsulfatase A-like enzyme
MNKPIVPFLQQTAQWPLSLSDSSVALWLVIAFLTVHSGIAVAADPSTGPYYGFHGTVGTTQGTSTPWWPDPIPQGTPPVPTPPASKTPPAGAPNIVVVLADDVGYSDIGPFGSEIPTPNLDKLANNGLRFRNYTTHSLCSPTRAALLTGLNGHSAGVGFIADSNPGYPGYTGQIQQNAVTIAEILHDNGYATFATGKWHLTAGPNRGKNGPYDSWPLQRGFDNFYGFLHAETHPQHPSELYDGNQRVTVDQYPHDFSTSDLWSSKAIQYIKTTKTANPSKPFFLYLANNAVHAPHNPRADLLAAAKGKYAAGWDAIRQARFQKQKDSGLIPANTVLPPLNPGVVAWNTLSSTDQHYFARQQEAYAAYVATLDRSFGQLYDYLQSSGQLNNTIIVFASDNGGSGEGGSQGSTINLEITFTQGLTDKAYDLSKEDLIGGPQTSPHYPVGWATVSNTPFRGYKQQTVGGGRRVPLIVSWPGHITDPGSIRTQFTNVTDITPTLLDVAGISHPDTYKGIATKPLEGTSFAYLLNAANANSPEQHTQQYFELSGSRGYYNNDGTHAWYAVTQHVAGQPFTPSEWQLYDLNNDFSETNNLAAANPTVVSQLDTAFDTAAWAHQVYPLFQRSAGIATALQPAYLTDLIHAKTFHTGDWAEQADILPLISPYWNAFGSAAAGTVKTTGNYTIQSTVQYNAGNRGVIFAIGGEDQGLILYIENGELALENSAFGHTTKFPRVPLTPGLLDISFRLQATPQTGAPVTVTNGVVSGGAPAGGGTGTLTVNDVQVATGTLSPWSVNLPSFFGAPRDGLDIGLDRRSPVSWDLFKKYGVFKYSGVIDHVTVTPQ